MKKSQLRQIIKEEIKRSLLEDEGDWKETFNSKIKTINPNDYTSATHLATYIKQILTGTMGENSVNEYASEAQQLHYQEIIKNNKWESYKEAWDYLQHEDLEDQMISSILDNAGMHDENENPNY